MKRTTTLLAALSVAGLGFAATSTDALAHGKKTKSHSWHAAKTSKHDAIRAHKAAKMQAWQDKMARKAAHKAAMKKAWEHKKARKMQAIHDHFRAKMEWKMRKFHKKAPTPLG